MTYKNTKFDESAVMRSLEKLALENGMIKPDEIKKSASTKPQLNLKPTTDLSENILKLCSGLRAGGFHKQAQDIENKFINLKQAETNLYNTTGETGDDLVDQAHPDGSHDLHDLDGDATVENLIDISKKMREVAMKPAKGKLANHNAINLVKLVLAQDNTNEVSLKDKAVSNIQSAVSLVQKVKTMVENSDELRSVTESWMNAQFNSAANIDYENLTIGNVNSLSTMINTWKRNLQPNFLHNWLPNIFNKGLNDDTFFARIDKILDQALSLTKEAKVQLSEQINSGLPAMAPKNETSNPTGGTREPEDFQVTTHGAEFLSKVNSGKKALKRYQATVSVNKTLTPEEKQKAATWINEQQDEFDKLTHAGSGVDADERDQWFQENMNLVDALLAENAKFNTDWVQ